ncbi:hypothetical protein Goari_003578 [Gossypium aridum]|uniref:Uncharacterized protein n=1 Tax=Gossypium aridum TaxID=34290 RepID=A0A7J8YCS0_GOSAI|nr:hypothetical protein [Gossypium aridum]
MMQGIPAPICNIVRQHRDFKTLVVRELMFYYFGRCILVMEGRDHPISLEHLKIIQAYFTANIIVDPVSQNFHT